MNKFVYVPSDAPKKRDPLVSWREWGEKMKFLRSIHAEPEMIAKHDAAVKAREQADR